MKILSLLLFLSANSWAASGFMGAGPAAKGTQGAYAQSSQEQKDAGRTRIIFSTTSMASSIGVLFSTFNYDKGGALTSNTSFYVVSSGKTLRIQAFNFGIAPKAAGVAASSDVFTFVEGLTVPVFSYTLGVSTFASQNQNFVVPDGLEFPGGTQIGIQRKSNVTTLSEEFSIVGYEY